MSTSLPTPTRPTISSIVSLAIFDNSPSPYPSNSHRVVNKLLKRAYSQDPLLLSHAVSVDFKYDVEEVSTFFLSRGWSFRKSDDSATISYDPSGLEPATPKGYEEFARRLDLLSARVVHQMIEEASGRLLQLPLEGGGVVKVEGRPSRLAHLLCKRPWMLEVYRLAFPDWRWVATDLANDLADDTLAGREWFALRVEPKASS